MQMMTVLLPIYQATLHKPCKSLGFHESTHEARQAYGETNKLYYLMDEQWTTLTAYDVRSALIDDKKEKQNSQMSPATPSHMSHVRSPT